MNLHDSVESAVTAQPVDGVLLLQRVRAQRQSRQRLRTAAAVLTSAATVAAVSLAGPFLNGAQDTQPAPPASALPPAGQQAVSWHGVQVFVPEAWQLHDLRCHEPQSDTVIVPGQRDDCLLTPVPGLTVVEFGPDVGEHSDGQPVAISGFQGRRMKAPLTHEDGTREVLVLPELDVTVSVRSPDPERARTILDTAQVVEVDAKGCPSELPGTTPPEPTVPGAGDRVLPGTPSRLVMCQYGDLRFERSDDVPGDAVQQFQAALDAAPVGTSPSRVGVSVSAELCPEYDRSPTVLIASYPDGGRLQIFTRLNSCTGPDPNNGARQVIVTSETIINLFQAVFQASRS